MENQKMPEYETIRAAVAGEKWAVEKVVECYKDEIDRLSTVAVRQPDGSTKQEINEDMRQSITKKLIEARTFALSTTVRCFLRFIAYSKATFRIRSISGRV